MTENQVKGHNSVKNRYLKKRRFLKFEFYNCKGNCKQLLKYFSNYLAPKAKW